MDVIDISRDLLKTPEYPGDPKNYVELVQRIKGGDSCNLSAVYTCLHTATHVDAPRHFIDDGATIDELPLDVFIGECYVVEAPPGPITGDYADKNFYIEGCERLLIKGNGLAHLMESTAYDIALSGIKLIGIDNCTIGKGETNPRVHTALLAENIPIIEGLDLSDVEPGRYFLMAQPIKIGGVEAAPLRAVLVKEHIFWTGTI